VFARVNFLHPSASYFQSSPAWNNYERWSVSAATFWYFASGVTRNVNWGLLFLSLPFTPLLFVLFTFHFFSFAFFQPFFLSHLFFPFPFRLFSI